ncbi:hypothetical protein L9F63_009798, partial [Diploptera punctata]
TYRYGVTVLFVILTTEMAHNSDDFRDVEECKPSDTGNCGSGHDNKDKATSGEGSMIALLAQLTLSKAVTYTNPYKGKSGTTMRISFSERHCTVAAFVISVKWSTRGQNFKTATSCMVQRK